MPKRKRKTSNNEKIQVEEVKEEKKETVTEQVKTEVVETPDPVIEHLKSIGVLDAWRVADDPINSPMSFYVGIVVPKGRKVSTPIPAIIKANSNTGYVRSMIPVPPTVIPALEKALREAIVKCEQLKSEAAKRQREIEIKQMLAKLSKEDIELLKKMLGQVK